MYKSTGENEVYMDKRALNIGLNMLKDKNPTQIPVIEGVQQLFNEKVETATPEQKRSLLMFPMQYAAYRIKQGAGEWTTQLHIWADNLLDTLLQLNPLYLTTRDSNGDTVLHRLVKAAVGEFTEQVNYPFIKKLLDKDMGFVSVQLPFDDASKKAGDAWLMTDVEGKTPMDLLAEFAMGQPESGMPADDQLLIMLKDFCEAPAEEIDIATTTAPTKAVPAEPGTEQAAPEQAPQQSEPAPEVQVVPADKNDKNDEKMPEDAKHHPAPEARPQDTIPSKVDRSVLEALLRL